MSKWLKLPLDCVIYGTAAIIAAGYIWGFVVSLGPNYPKRTIPADGTPPTPFQHDLAQAGRWNISKEVAALIPKTFDEAVKFVGASASPRTILTHRGVHPLGPNAEDEATSEADKRAINALRSGGNRAFPGRELLRGTGFTVRLDGTETATFSSLVTVYLYEPAEGGVLVSAWRYDGTVFYPL